MKNVQELANEMGYGKKLKTKIFNFLVDFNLKRFTF